MNIIKNKMQNSAIAILLLFSSGLILSGNTFAAPTNTLFATKADIAREVQARKAADAALQSQINNISSPIHSEKLLTYHAKVTSPDTSGTSHYFEEAADKVFEINVSATCTYSDSGDHAITVRVKDLDNFDDRYVKSANSNGGKSASIMTGPIVGFQTDNSPAFSVECGTAAEIEVIALGRVMQ